MPREDRKKNCNKFIELILAIRLELSYSKNEILAYYVSNAPFGGNVVGLEAAAWRYYGRSANKLSWGESATYTHTAAQNSAELPYPTLTGSKAFLPTGRGKISLKNTIEWRCQFFNPGV